MSYINKIGALVIVCFLTVTTTRADEPRWYVSAETGKSDLEYFENNVDGFLSLDDKATVWGATIGFQALTNVAIEIGYSDHGSFTGQGFNCPSPAVCVAGVFPARADLKSININIVPTWPINERLSLVGKIGPSRWDLSSTIPAPKEDDVDISIGGAIRWQFNKGFSLQAGYESAGDRQSILVGLRYGF